MAKIRDDNQKYIHSHTQVWEDGSEFSVYSSPKDQRMVLRHTSGSHLEFKADGSIFVTAVKDFHFSAGANSGEGNQNSDKSEGITIEFDTDTHIKCNGNLTIGAKEFDMEVKETGKFYAGREFKHTSNTHVIAAEEQLSLEPAKSLYVDTKEYRERVVSKQTENGSLEEQGGKTGGLEVKDVHGNYVIRNTDLKGGITIQSAGYLNLVCGAERVDLTGFPGAIAPKFAPSTMAKATYTHIVGPNPGPIPRGVPGSAFFQVGPGGYTQLITGPTLRKQTGPSIHNFIGPFTETYSAMKKKTVGGAEIATIAGIYRVKAKTIFLN